MLLATCFDEAALDSMRVLEGKTVTLAADHTSAVQENITAVLTHSATDVLSHIAIRARSQGVLLATCFDEAALDTISAGRQEFDSCC